VATYYCLAAFRAQAPISTPPDKSRTGNLPLFSDFHRKMRASLGERSYPWQWKPVGSPVISQSLQHAPLKPGPHKIQGIGAGAVWRARKAFYRDLLWRGRRGGGSCDSGRC
jgi:hypothetical protein